MRTALATLAIPACTLALLLIIGFAAPTATASTADHLDSALAAWDVKAARAMLDAGIDGYTRARTQAAWAWVHFIEGDYRRAEEILPRASEPSAQALAPLLRATREAVRDFTRAASPSGRFVASYRPGPDEAMLPYVFEAAEAAYDMLAARFAPPPPVPVRIEILPSFEALSAVSGLSLVELRTSGAVAVCKYGKLMLVSPSRLPWGYPFADTTAHELIHFALTARAGDALPVWFQEAVAKYLEPTWRNAAPGTLHRSLRVLLSDALARGRLIPFSMMKPSLARLARIEDTALAFAELSTFAGWLERTFGDRILGRLADELAAGPEDPALQRATGRNLAELSAAWQQDLAGWVTPSRAGATGRVVLLLEMDGSPVASPGPDVSAAMRLGDILRSAGRPAAAAVEYGKAIAGLGRSDPVATARLALALVDSGAWKEAIEALDEAALDEDEFPALARERGRALAALGRPEQAMDPLLAAVRTDPYDPQVHGDLEKIMAAMGRQELAEREHRLAALWR